MLEISKSQPSTLQIADELWKSVQPILHAQKNLSEINHNTHMELIKITVDARYNDTQADIRVLKNICSDLLALPLHQSLKKMMMMMPRGGGGRKIK
ncbi:hypothetical protein Hanom_Chr00s000002g01600401 [Helianthus anomalus]